MGKKLSNLKGKKIIGLYLEGHNQTIIAKKLHVDQSTVSKYISNFKTIKEQNGLDAALLAFEVEDQLEENQNVVEEFKKSDLTIADVDIALQVEKVLQECGIPQEEYMDFIQTCKKTKDSGYLEAAMKLNQLGNKTGMEYEEIVASSEKEYKKLLKFQKELKFTNTLLKTSQADFAEIIKQKKQATQDLEMHMEQIGVDEHRLKSVEALALILKKAKIPDQELPDYIQRQELLNKADVSIQNLTNIIEKTKVVTSSDSGNKLLNLLTKYGNLPDIIKALELKVQKLKSEASKLEPQANLKEKLDSEVSGLKSEKTCLEVSLTKLSKCIEGKKNELDQIICSVEKEKLLYDKLTSQDAKLKHDINEEQAIKTSLDDEINLRKQSVADLSDLQTKREQVIKETVELEAEINHRKKRLEISESFLGFVQAASVEETKEKAQAWLHHLPVMMDKKYTPKFLKDMILEDFGGPELQILKCNECQGRFMVDKAAEHFGYRCPVCSSSLIVIEKDTLDIITAALPKPVIQVIKISKSKTKEQANPLPESKGSINQGTSG